MATRMQAGSIATLLMGVLSSVVLAQGNDGVPFVASGMGTLSPGPDGQLIVSASGHATHLGTYAAHGTQRIEPGMPPTFYGEVTLVGANGDSLDVIVGGIMTGLPPNPSGKGHYAIVGGTGRFDGATGEGSFDAGPDGTRFVGSIHITRNQ